jgi:hypothetical protein
MVTLAAMILERDKERGRRRSQSATPRTSDAVTAQNQPAHNYRNEGKPAFRPSAALFLLGVVLKTTPSSSRLAYGLNPGFQCAHYLPEAQS